MVSGYCAYVGGRRASSSLRESANANVKRTKAVKWQLLLSRDLERNSLVYFRDQVFRIGDVARRLNGVYYAVLDLRGF